MARATVMLGMFLTADAKIGSCLTSGAAGRKSPAAETEATNSNFEKDRKNLGKTRRHQEKFGSTIEPKLREYSVGGATQLK